MFTVLFCAARDRAGGGRSRRGRRPAGGRAGRPLEVLEPRIALSGAQGVAALPEVDLASNLAKFQHLPYQQDYNDCTANAVAADLDYQIATNPALASLKNGGFVPSRRFLYYNTRFIDDGKVSVDGGSFTRDMLESAEIQGVTSEVKTPGIAAAAITSYPGPKQGFRVNPGAAAYTASPSYRITGFAAVPSTVTAMQQTLNGGQPILISIDVFKNFPGSQDDQPKEIPTIPLPHGASDGKHAMLVVGYNDAKQAFLTLNSWGKDWGKGGYAYMPYAYVTNSKWGAAEFAVSGISVNPPPATIGKLGDLVARTGSDPAKGEVHIDTQTAESAGTASAFTFFSRSRPGADVTPLLFSYDAQAGTYTLTGIGRSYANSASGSQGIPFDVVAGSSQVTTSTVFGFYDGRLDVTREAVGSPKSFTPGAANHGVVPFDTGAAGTTSWLTTAGGAAKGLTIGATFSTGAGRIPLDSSLSNRVYSAMLVE